jgi:ribosome-binding factor A
VTRERLTDRMRRVNEVLRQVLADAIEQLADPGLGFVTVTAVRASGDVSQAIVYVSVLGGQKKRTAGMRALERAKGTLQRRIAGDLHLKRTPLLTFRYDETLDRALRLNELMEQAAPTAHEDA